MGSIERIRADFERLVKRPEHSFDLARAALLIAAESNPNVDVDQNADAGARLNVLDDKPFFGFATGLFGRSCYTFFAKNVDGTVQVTAGFGKRLFAIHEACIGHLAKLRYACGTDLGHRKICELKLLPYAIAGTVSALCGIGGG